MHENDKKDKISMLGTIACQPIERFSIFYNF